MWAVPLPELIYAKLICVKLEFHGGRGVHFGNKKSFRPKYTFVCRGLYTVVGFYRICRIWWMKTASPDEGEVSIFNFVF